MKISVEKSCSVVFSRYKKESDNLNLKIYENRIMSQKEIKLKGYKLCIIPEEAKTISIGQKRKRGRPKKQKAALFYPNDCDLSSSENESNPEQAVVKQQSPSDSVIEATVQATVDLPRKRGRPKKSTTQGKESKLISPLLVIFVILKKFNLSPPKNISQRFATIADTALITLTAPLDNASKSFKILKHKKNPCSNSSCSHLCLLKSDTDYECSCPDDGKFLDGEASTCDSAASLITIPIVVIAILIISLFGLYSYKKKSE
ncbi:hypothetical protein BpHYR1_014821, partial [Brachionus plicatilis]